jgi:hypothetical protein
MRHDTIVEITPDGRPALRLVIVPDNYPQPPKSDHPEPESVVIISYEEDDPYVVKENTITWEV